MHPRLSRRAAWLDHPADQDLPILEGTLIRLQVDRLPGDRTPKPLWLWTSRTDTTAEQVDRAWQGFLRRFDLEHTFRFFKQQLGWTAPRLRDPAAADRWTWLTITVHTQLRLARGMADDLRYPWERPCPPEYMTPTRARQVRRAAIARPRAASCRRDQVGDGVSWWPPRRRTRWSPRRN